MRLVLESRCQSRQRRRCNFQQLCCTQLHRRHRLSLRFRQYQRLQVDKAQSQRRRRRFLPFRELLQCTRIHLQHTLHHHRHQRKLLKTH